MTEQLFDGALLLGRWIHITAAITWIGTSIFFMWLDRHFIKVEDNQTKGHLGELWMVHGGGFYKVEKLQMGPTKIPQILHWFKWEAYTTWLSGMFLLIAIFYTGQGTYLLDSEVSDISFLSAAGLGLGGLILSWTVYDLIWESPIGKTFLAHIFTAALFLIMVFVYHHYLSGRAAYIHIGALMGTWMVGNVLLRIIPRQVKMVEASKENKEVPQHWAQNAKSRSTHNTYFTLPVIFIMFSNHFPSTYGHDYNAFILLLLCFSGALIRHYFVVRNQFKSKNLIFAFLGVFFFLFALMTTNSEIDQSKKEKMPISSSAVIEKEQIIPIPQNKDITAKSQSINGTIFYRGEFEKKILSLPKACQKIHGKKMYSQSILVNNAKLKNSLVFLSGDFDKTQFSTPKDEVKIDQVGCLYAPKTVGVRVNQQVRFINSDPIFHNVRTLAKNNKKFNKAMPKKDSSFVKIFDKPELPLLAKCSVHPWMRANIAVFDHPFFNVTDEDGHYEIKNIPPGKYTLNFWHEKLGHIKEAIQIDGKLDSQINFTFK